MGSLPTFFDIAHSEKWIHWESKQGWCETYSVPHAMEELTTLFDRYLEGKEND
jgi:hypothetical protein